MSVIARTVVGDAERDRFVTIRVPAATKFAIPLNAETVMWSDDPPLDLSPMERDMLRAIAEEGIANYADETARGLHAKLNGDPEVLGAGAEDVLAASLRDEFGDTYHTMTRTDARDLARRMIRGTRGKPLLKALDTARDSRPVGEDDNLCRWPYENEGETTYCGLYRGHPVGGLQYGHHFVAASVLPAPQAGPAAVR